MRISSELLPPTIEQIDRDIEGGFRRLVFSSKLERTYEADTRRARERHLIRTNLIAAVLYNLYLISDWQMEPDVFSLCVIARVGICTPLLLIASVVFACGPPRWLREGLAGLVAIMCLSTGLVVLGMSHSPDRILYQADDILIIVFVVMVQRLQIRYALAAVVGMLVVQLTFSAQLSDMTPRLLGHNVSFFVIGSVLLLWAASVLEREHRRSYLLDLRGRLLNDHLDRIAKQDALTGLWNRRHLETVIASAWTRAKDRPICMSVILLDIDHFKIFNDSYGHLEGDECLRRLATCVQSALADHAKASAVRFGGEEFLVLIDDAERHEATVTAERIRARIRMAAIPHPKLGEGMIVTASFGVATGSAPDLPPNRLIAAADEALYVAKRKGRDRVWSIVADAEAARPAPAAALPVAC